MKSISEPFIRVLTGFAGAGALFIAALPVLGMFGRWHWFLDLFSHFRIQYIVALVLAAVFFVCVRRKRWSLACGGVALLFGMPLIKFYLPVSQEGEGETITVLSHNVFTANERPGDVVRFLEKEDADVVFLMEVNAEWVRRLSVLEDRYPHRIEESREDNFGVALFSKLPLRKGGVRVFGGTGLPSIDVLLETGGNELRLIGTHPPPPAGRSGSRYRNDQLRALEEAIATARSPHTVVAGDFNLTPFSAYYARFLRRTGLVDASMGHGIAPTWMREVPWIAIPLDYVFVSKSMRVHDRRIGDRLGSDHNPVIVELSIGR